MDVLWMAVLAISVVFGALGVVVAVRVGRRPHVLAWRTALSVVLGVVLAAGLPWMLGVRLEPVPLAVTVVAAVAVGVLLARGVGVLATEGVLLAPGSWVAGGLLGGAALVALVGSLASSDALLAVGLLGTWAGAGIALGQWLHDASVLREVHPHLTVPRRTCVACGAALDDEAQCPTCGAGQPRWCEGCGSALDPGREACGRCGLAAAAPPDRQESLTVCLVCGVGLSGGGTYCWRCGAVRHPSCPACGVPVVDGDDWCRACGTPLAWSSRR